MSARQSVPTTTMGKIEKLTKGEKGWGKPQAKQKRQAEEAALRRLSEWNGKGSVDIVSFAGQLVGVFDEGKGGLQAIAERVKKIIDDTDTSPPVRARLLSEVLKAVTSATVISGKTNQLEDLDDDELKARRTAIEKRIAAGESVGAADDDIEDLEEEDGDVS